MQAKEWMRTLSAKGIETEEVGDAIYRFHQEECEWMVPQYIIDQMIGQSLDQTTDYIQNRLFYLVRRIEE
ncbi:hypothetical protein BEP19_09640 [Ammoniphilus oxalaticus]|uniref:Uncharacterized protein n=1 Tax=Ammoniphilus oxalaticus TaxID=66863 RepID=A0A419SL17_9BACL|nr:hypothetical protein [Ammoniphilus oxalaticus]RKD24626.1 hypothetical protein BEP19_09640 [Ammoniphilus oxalaticus]